MTDEKEITDRVEIPDDEGKEFEWACEHCGSTPCDWEWIGKIAVGNIIDQFTPHNNDSNIFIRDEDGSTVGKEKIRKTIYSMFIYMKHGHLGKGNRLSIPSCVLDRIRDLFTSEDGDYMGFKDS